MTLNKQGLEAAARAIDPGLSRYLMEDCETIIRAYLAALPAPDGLVEKLRTAVQLATSMGARGQHASNIYNLAEEAATVIQTLQRERDEALDARREKLAALREGYRRKMNDAGGRAEMAAAAGDMAEVSINSTESERHREAFAALNVAIGIFDGLYESDR